MTFLASLTFLGFLISLTFSTFSFFVFLPNEPNKELALAIKLVLSSSCVATSSEMRSDNGLNPSLVLLGVAATACFGFVTAFAGVDTGADTGAGAGAGAGAETGST